MEINSKYLLMHKDIIVCSFDLTLDGQISNINKVVENISHFPIGGKMNSSCFIDWWKSRAIPENRSGIKDILKSLGYKSTGNALIDNLALSLTDCYWIKPIRSNLRWKDVNLYQNGFNDVIGKMQFNLNEKKTKLKKNKFDIASSSGELKKKWCINENGNRLLIKGNMSNSFQQSLNEVFISNIHKQLNPTYYLQYDLCKIEIDYNKTIIGCQSKCFCSETAELVTANDLIRSYKIKGSDNLFLIFKKACLNLGMSEEHFHDYMDYLILTDYLFTNIDRHMNNIGILRNPNTLELIDFAPIYDSGNSLFYNYSYDELHAIDLNKIKINSFFEKESKMLSYVKNKNRICLNNIHFDFSIFNDDITEYQIRYPLIEELFNRKIRMLEKFQKKADKN